MPTDHGVIAQPAGTVFLTVSNLQYSVAEFRVARTGKFSQALHDLPRLSGDQLGDHFIVEPCEKLAIANEITAIEHRNRKLGIRRVKLTAFGEGSCGGAKL